MGRKQFSVLVVDDDSSFRRILEYNLFEDGHKVQTASDGKEALACLEVDKFDVIITDIKMPGMDGMELLRLAKEQNPETEVIVITAFGTIEMAVEAMKAGAFEYITKPVNRDELKMAVKKAVKMRSLENENRSLKKEVKRKYGFENIIGQSEPMQKVFGLVEKVANTDASILITGESGTGKELIAKAIHVRGARSSGPFVTINCAAIPKELLESELFGHKKGAFTGAVKDKQGKFQQAHGGTLFLDEIGELSIDLQAKILRATQQMEVTPVGANETQKVDVRIVSATNRDLEQSIEEGLFREDLYYRLSVVPVHLPSLRERREDIPLLVKHFISQLSDDSGVIISPNALKCLKDHEWKGNVRELENMIERALILRDGNTIEVDDLPEKLAKTDSDRKPPGNILQATEGLGLEEAEALIIRAALESCDWNQSQAARMLKIPRHVLIYRMDKFSIPKQKPE